MVEAFFIVDREARRLLIMERTTCLKLTPRLGDLYGAANQRGKRRPRPQFIKPLRGEGHIVVFPSRKREGLGVGSDISVKARPIVPSTSSKFCSTSMLLNLITRYP